MAIEITHVRFGGRRKAEDEIVRYRWKTVNRGPFGESDKPSLVTWIQNNNGAAYVGSGIDLVDVDVIRPSKGQPYLCSHSDGNWTSDLLDLPTF